MAKFEPGDKVIMKEEVTGEELESVSIPKQNLVWAKTKTFTIKRMKYDDTKNEDKAIVALEESGYLWNARWFRYMTLIPEELFDMEE